MEPIAIAGLCVRRERVAHPLLGEAYSIEHQGRAITAMSVIDWDSPTEIPVVAEPAKLPPGSGGALLNLIAERAARAGVRTLRYAGPYPTPALYRTLLRSFRASADEATFTHDLIARAARVARDPVPVEFTPAPHRRIENAHGVAEVRDGVERVTIDGIAYEDGPEDRPQASRLRPQDDGRVRAEIWFGDARYAHVATFDRAGNLVEGPLAIPACTSAVIGKAFPPPLSAALAELVREAVPPPLADAVMLEEPIVWVDLGGRAARFRDGRYEVHAALWDRIAPLGLPRLALALAEALAPIVTNRLIAQLSSLRPEA